MDFYTQFASDEQFQEFLDGVKAQSAYDTGVEVTPEDKVITLMTCNKAGYDYRFLVHAVQTEAVQTVTWHRQRRMQAQKAKRNKRERLLLMEQEAAEWMVSRH